MLNDAFFAMPVFCINIIQHANTKLNTTEEVLSMKNRKMNKDQRKRTYATYSLLEYANLYDITNVVNPSEEAIELAKESVDENHL